MTRRDTGSPGDKPVKVVVQARMRDGGRAPVPPVAGWERSFRVRGALHDRSGAPRVDGLAVETGRRLAPAERVVALVGEAGSRFGDLILLCLAWAIGGGAALYF